jgi:hypothetical protein
MSNIVDAVLTVYKTCSHYDAQGPCGICWQTAFAAYAAEQVAQARVEEREAWVIEYDENVVAWLVDIRDVTRRYPLEHGQTIAATIRART